MTYEERNELRKDHIAEGVRDVRNVLCNLTLREQVDLMWYMMDDLVKDMVDVSETFIEFEDARKQFVNHYLCNKDWTRKGVLI